MSNQLSSGLSLKDDIASIWTDPTFHDVIIVCSDGVEIGACRAILASRSLFFRAMLYDNMQEAMSNKINLHNIKSTALHTVLQFIHTENINSTDNLAVMDMYHAADYLLLPNLMKLVLERAHDMKDLELSASLLNEATVSQPWSESTKELYNFLLKPFYTYSLAVGDLNGFSEDALELLLVQSTEMTTPEHDLLLCVVEWACSRNETAQSAIERRAIFDAVNRMPTEPSARILLRGDPSRTLLLKMMQHIDFTLICPHRLKYLYETVDVLTDTSPQYLSLCDYAIRNTKCYAGHPSKSRGISKPKFEWEQGCTVIEFPDDINMFLSVRTSTPCMAGLDGLCEWDIIVESTIELDRNILGFVSDSVNHFAEHTIFKDWDGIEATIFIQEDVFLDDYGSTIRQGDIITFHLNLNDRSCAMSINGTYYGTIWINLPLNKNLYPAAILHKNARYRIRPHVRL